MHWIQPTNHFHSIFFIITSHPIWHKTESRVAQKSLLRMVLTTVRTQFQFGLITCVPDIFQVHVSKVKSGQIPHPQSSSRVGPIISLKALAVGVERGETKRIFFQRNVAFTFCLSTFPVPWVVWVWRGGGGCLCISLASFHLMHHPHPSSYTKCTKEDIIILLSFLHYWNASLSRPTAPMHHFKHRPDPRLSISWRQLSFHPPPPTISPQKSAPGPDTLGSLHEFNLHPALLGLSNPLTLIYDRI